MAEEIKTKICKECGRELPIDQFGGQYKSKDGHLSICKECMSKKRKEVAQKRKVWDVYPDNLEEEIKRSIFSVEELKIILSLKYKDQELADELRRRGYDVKCTKMIEL